MPIENLSGDYSARFLGVTMMAGASRKRHLARQNPLRGVTREIIPTERRKRLLFLERISTRSSQLT
jgi:hypothetical protein